MVNQIASAFHLLVQLPLLYHLRRGLVEPSELKIELVAVLFEQKVYLHFFYHDQQPAIRLAAEYLGWSDELRNLQLVHLLFELLGRAEQVSGREARAHNGELLLREAQIHKVDHLDVFHLVDFEKVDDLPNRGQLPCFEKMLLR